MATLIESDSIFEEREELMISPTTTGDSNPVLRKAHFLKPTLTSTNESSSSSSPLKNFHSNFSTDAAEKLPLDVSFSGWRCPQKKWKSWVDRLRPKHEATWRKAGIYEAILNSTFNVKRNDDDDDDDDDLVLALAEKWCCETNTFKFRWGEVTISLEDMIVLGGFSVLGQSVVYPFGADKMVMMKECLTGSLESAKQNAWLNQFYDESGYEYEHEAFLVLWLSRFVFPGGSFDSIRECVYPIADCLARGIKIALAPAVLASIYRDLSLLKEIIVAAASLSNSNLDVEENNVFSVNVSAPFQLVQVWIWERFMELQPKPNMIQLGEPVFAKWDKVKTLQKTDDIKLVLESAASSFLWRPYNPAALNVQTNQERSVLVDSSLGEDIHSFVRCVRVAELVGLDSIEQYLPHRIAMQFGIDQDIPGHVARSNETVELAWANYIRPIGDVRLYVPAKLCKSDVTNRYLEWWKNTYCSFAIVQGAQADPGPSACTMDGLLVNDEIRFSPNISSDLEKVKITTTTAHQGVSSEAGFIGTENGHVGESTQPLSSIQSPNLLFDGSVNATIVHDDPIKRWQCTFNPFWDLKNLPPPPGFLHKYQSRLEVENIQDEALIKGPEGELDNGTTTGDSANRHGCIGLPPPPGFRHMYKRRVEVEKSQDEAVVSKKPEGEMDNGSAGDASSSMHGCKDKTRMLELESRICELEKVFNDLKLAKIMKRINRN